MTENIYFESVKNIIGETLGKRGFNLVAAEEQPDGNFRAEFTDGNEKVAVLYDLAGRKFNLLRASGEEEYASVQAYLFDEAAGDGEAQAVSVANEFLESLEVPGAKSVRASANRQSAPTATRKTKDRESDETGSVFFVNRIPNLLPETKAPMLAHKEHYGQLLPNRFCEECVAPAFNKLIGDGKSAKLDKFVEFLGNMYHSGDTDVKSIITMTILNSVTAENNIDWLQEKLPDELKKAWPAARKFIGKNVAPEKDSVTQKMFKAMGQNTTNSLR